QIGVDPGDERAGDLDFSALPDGGGAALAIDQFGTVGLGADRTRMIEDNGVAVLGLELSQRMLARVLRFQRKADDPAVSFALAKLRQDVGCFDELQEKGLSCFRDFSRQALTGPEIPDSG